MSGIIHKIYTALLGRYDVHAESTGADRLVGWLESRALMAPAYELVPEVKGVLDEDFECLVATNTRGLLHVSAGGCRGLLGLGGAYGITRCSQSGDWYVFQKQRFHGRILRLRIEQGHVRHCEPVLYGLSRGIHQIDTYRDTLLITDTYNNRLLTLAGYQDVRDRHWKSVTDAHYPLGKLAEGRTSANYGHINSVYAVDDGFYLTAHNETYKTGRASQVLHVNADFTLASAQTVDGSNAHNVYPGPAGNLVCASLEGALLQGDRVVFKTDLFTRGLAITDDGFVLGASAMELEREQRERSERGSGVLYVLDPEFAVRATITIPGAQINEVRRIDQPDRGLSENKTA